MFLNKVYRFVILSREIFIRCPLIWCFISKTKNIFWNFLGSTYWLQSKRKSDTRDFCLLVCLRSYNSKSKFAFLQTLQSSLNTSNLRMNHVCAKCSDRFLALIYLYTLKKNSWKNYVRFWKWKLKRPPKSTQNSFSRKSNLTFCIIFNMISFANTQGSVKIRIACSKVLLLINYFDRRFWNSFKNIL